MGSSPGLPTAGQPGPMKPGEFVSASQPSLVSFNFERIAPPSPLYIARDDVIRLRAWSGAAGVSIGPAYRFLLADPRGAGKPPTLVPGTQVFALGSTRALQDFTVTLGEGFLLSVAVQVALGTPSRGQVFCSLGILRSAAAGSGIYQMLLADYVVGSNPIGWPGGRIIDPREGPGVVRSSTLANPAAGADWTFTVPTNARWRVQSVKGILTTSAAVANRVPRILLNDGASNVYIGTPNQSVPAGSNPFVSGAPITATAAANVTDVLVPLPPTMYLEPGYTISSSTVGIQGADQWSGLVINVEEWIDIP